MQPVNCEQRRRSSESIPFYELKEFTDLGTIYGNNNGVMVFKGNHTDFGTVAIKGFVLTKKIEIEKCKKEIEILFKHRHPNIVPVYGILWDGSDSSRYLGYVMEYVARGSLRDVIHEPGNYSVHEVWHWIEQICRGLRYLHTNNIIHRDVKPANILMASVPKLADFGISRDIGTSATAGVGTLYYIAPEVHLTPNYGPEADIYSLAITIWEIFHRKEPYSELKDVTGYSLTNMIVKGGRPTIDPTKIDGELPMLIQRCWHTDVSERPTIEEILEFLGANEPEAADHHVLHQPEWEIVGFSGTTNTILFMGGTSETFSNLSDEMVILDQDKWIKLALRLPRPSSGGGAVFLEGELYICGGWGMDKAVYKLDNQSFKWKRLADMNEAHQDMTSSCLQWNGEIWVFGGCRNKSVERYDPKKDKWTRMSDMKYPRWYAAAAVLNGKFVICGGFDNGPSNKVECFDPESGVWTELNDLPTLRSGHSLVTHGNQLILMAGCNEKGRLQSVLALSSLNEAWRELPPMKHPSDCFGVAILNDEIYALGGKIETSEFLDKCEIFNGQSWRLGPQLPSKIGDMSAVVISQYLAKLFCNYG